MHAHFVRNGQHRYHRNIRPDLVTKAGGRVSDDEIMQDTHEALPNPPREVSNLRR